MSTVKVQTLAWEYGWELHVEGYGVTQVENYANAEQQVRDFLATLECLDASLLEILVQ